MQKDEFFKRTDWKDWRTVKATFDTGGSGMYARYTVQTFSGIVMESHYDTTSFILWMEDSPAKMVKIKFSYVLEVY